MYYGSYNITNEFKRMRINRLGLKWFGTIIHFLLHYYQSGFFRGFEPQGDERLFRRQGRFKAVCSGGIFNCRLCRGRQPVQCERSGINTEPRLSRSDTKH